VKLLQVLVLSVFMLICATRHFVLNKKFRRIFPTESVSAEHQDIRIASHLFGFDVLTIVSPTTSEQQKQSAYWLQALLNSSIGFSQGRI